jgi:2-deoxy-D-gluconate 3-dehydrogenase
LLPRTPSYRLDGKRAVVIGGSRGIGLGCAVALAEQGASVVIVARSKGQVFETVNEMKSEGFSVSGAPMDVSIIDNVKNLMGEYSDIDILVNSAGIARHTPTVDTTELDFDDVMSVNVRSAYFLAQSAAKQMISKGTGGSIIQISSQMAHVGGIDRAVYCGTKHAIEGINKSMAIEFGPHKIRVNSICPTFIRTPFTEPTFKDPEKVKWIESKIKVGRVGEVEDIMGAVKFLASDVSAMVTGSSILIDGGWTAG